MRTPDGQFVVCRPAVVWPLTAFCLFGLVALVAVALH
jgi:hypothetical protein